MTLRDADDEGRPSAGAALSDDSLGGGYTVKDTDSALFAAAVGRALMAEPEQLAGVMGTIVPADLPEPYAYAWTLLIEIRDAGVDPGDNVCDAFAERAARPRAGMVPRFQPGPRSWAA